MFLQVQLLVTSQDVENYKQIKSDLDQLRSIVEKSELWVYKRQGPDEGMDGGEGLSTEPDHKKVHYILHQKNHTLTPKRRLPLTLPLPKTIFSHALSPAYLVGQFRGHRQTKESRKHQQLQLQGGEGGNDLTYKSG